GSRRGPGWPVVAIAAGLGVAIGATVPRVGETAAVYVDEASVVGHVDVRQCSDAWTTAVAGLSPTRHLDLGASSALPGDTPAPGLLACDPTGALTLRGGPEEHAEDPAGPIATGSAQALAFWVALDASADPGDLVWLTRPDGSGLGVRVAGGLLELVESGGGGSPLTVLAQVGAPASGAHLVTVTRAGADTVTLRLGNAAVATVTPSGAGSETVRLVVGAPAGSGRAAARAVVDEVVVIPGPLDAGQVAALVAANTW
ncbi:MAG TPA: hypothetical protein PKB06_12260, partial [Actinotalea sp.]|nr:hypothetical protein [Actinotalea sp.]